MIKISFYCIGWFFTQLTVIFCKKDSTFMGSYWTILDIISWKIGVLFRKNPLPRSMSCSTYSIFSSSTLAFQDLWWDLCLICCWLLWKQRVIYFHFSACTLLIFPTLFFEDAVYSAENILDPQLKTLCQEMLVFKSGFSILFHWNMYLCLCH